MSNALSRATGADSLTSLATRINETHNRTLQLAGDALQSARECGESLFAAREQVAHSNWLFWLADHCDGLSPRQARKYVRLYREWPAIEHAAHNETLSLDGALALIAVPRANAPSSSHLEEPEPNDEAAAFPTIGERLVSAVGSVTGVTDEVAPIFVPLPRLGEALIAKAGDELDFVEVIPTEVGESYFVSCFSDEDGEFVTDFSKRDVFGFAVADLLPLPRSIRREDVARFVWRSISHQPLRRGRHPLSEGDEWGGPNPNVPLYWLAKTSEGER